VTLDTDKQKGIYLHGLLFLLPSIVSRDAISTASSSLAHWFTSGLQQKVRRLQQHIRKWKWCSRH